VQQRLREAYIGERGLLVATIKAFFFEIGGFYLLWANSLASFEAQKR